MQSTRAPLSAAQVAERVGRGESNVIESRTSRSFGEIFRANAFTRVNRLVLSQLDGFAHDLHAFLTMGARVPDAT